MRDDKRGTVVRYRRNLIPGRTVFTVALADRRPTLLTTQVVYQPAYRRSIAAQNSANSAGTFGGAV